jgi:hypothetical protein
LNGYSHSLSSGNGQLNLKLIKFSFVAQPKSDQPLGFLELETLVSTFQSLKALVEPIGGESRGYLDDALPDFHPESK